MCNQVSIEPQSCDDWEILVSSIQSIRNFKNKIIKHTKVYRILQCTSSACIQGYYSSVLLSAFHLQKVSPHLELALTKLFKRDYLRHWNSHSKICLLTLRA